MFSLSLLALSALSLSLSLPSLSLSALSLSLRSLPALLSSPTVQSPTLDALLALFLASPDSVLEDDFRRDARSVVSRWPVRAGVMQALTAAAAAGAPPDFLRVGWGVKIIWGEGFEFIHEKSPQTQNSGIFVKFIMQSPSHTTNFFPGRVSSDVLPIFFPSLKMWKNAEILKHSNSFFRTPFLRLCDYPICNIPPLLRSLRRCLCLRLWLCLLCLYQPGRLRRRPIVLRLCLYRRARSGRPARRRVGVCAGRRAGAD
jgi:hypothetical protein